MTLLFFGALTWPIVCLLGKRARSCGLSYLTIPYGAYLFMSASNPLLLNTTGMLLVISVWGVVLILQKRVTVMQYPRAMTYSLDAV